MDFVISYPALAGQTQVASAMPTVPGATTVNIAGFVFAPGGLTVAPGKAITWINTDESPHQITVQGTPLKTGFLLKGQRATLTFPDRRRLQLQLRAAPEHEGVGRGEEVERRGARGR